MVSPAKPVTLRSTLRLTSQDVLQGRFPSTPAVLWL
ncbi:BQ5605_C014g07489 [Microbotryum silenes-dioicae]|uniref:BQ5605_C014g07489 protein n=1 Tax=Microbotryum silenes-dioicae TaxID=796604 RepID=A0A2X0MNF4_9BASI|nr:BQ5605_C014g07489 [Microbotryum silenes-dioicae]